MEFILTSVIAFVTTNIDDLFILILFFSDKRYKTSDIYLGQFLGMFLLVAVSIIGSFIGYFVEYRYVGLLGLVPLFIGLRSIISLIGQKVNFEGVEPTINNGSDVGMLAVSSVVFASGGDNIAIYVPLFSRQGVCGKLVMIGMFLLMIDLLLVTARYLTGHPFVAKLIARYDQIVMPVVFCLLGLYILCENGSFKFLA